jgi:L-glutamine-phosphate cytidylyltransferase
MKAIVLSAGQGRRLLPLTTTLPKCLLTVDRGRTILELQLHALAACGIRRVTVMVGFGAAQVEQFLMTQPIDTLRVRTRYNPFFTKSNNLATCWLAAPEMSEDFVLLNGDTLFEPDILRRVLAATDSPVTLAIDQKVAYDDDDMKVALDGDKRIVAVSKTIAASSINGESLGLMAFRGHGVTTFQAALDDAVRDPKALDQWYLEVINTMARSVDINTALSGGHWWAEVDTPEDLAQARAHFDRRRASQQYTTSPSSLVNS